MGFQLQRLFALASGFGELAETLQAVHAPLVRLDLPLLKTAPLTKVQLAFRVAPGTAIPQGEGAHHIGVVGVTLERAFQLGFGIGKISMLTQAQGFLALDARQVGSQPHQTADSDRGDEEDHQQPARGSEGGASHGSDGLTNLVRKFQNHGARQPND